MPRLHREVMRLLIGEIASSALAVGERLPREVDLAAQHGVSRAVVRECVRGLEERGLVAVTQGHPAKVNPVEKWDMFDPDVLSALLSGDRRTRILAEYLECRQILEVEAAGQAAERATEEHVEALTEAFARMKANAERARVNSAAESLYLEADLAFHRAVVDATENYALARMIEPIHRALQATLRTLARPDHRFERGLPEHEAILVAIVARDGEAAREAMRAHLATVGANLREYAEARGESFGSVDSLGDWR
jgi:DNA-binding FadR family transcriptional regulator